MCKLIGCKQAQFSGRLLECGRLVCRDGSVVSWGGGQDPNDPRFCYVREIDCVSSVAVPLSARATR